MGNILELRPIETEFKGYRFRSRTEARWAIFFEQLPGIDWSYEVQGFKLPNGEYYLPDFLVTTPQGRQIWYEVKAEGSDRGISKVESFNLTEETCYLLRGDPYAMLADESRVFMCPRCSLICDPCYGISVMSDGDAYYGCQPCDNETPCGGGNPPEPGVFLDIWPSPHKGMLHVDGRLWPSYVSKVKSIAKYARRIRFEHGEKPSPLGEVF